MIKFRVIFLTFLWTFVTDCFAQDSLTSDKLIIKRGQKQIDLNKMTVLEITQNIKGGEKDSVFLSIVPDSVYKVNDTLYVKPYLVEEQRFLDLDNPYSNRKYYDYRSKTILKVPLNQVGKIRAKKQPIAFILGTTTTIAYITYLTSTFVAVASPVDAGKKMILISGAVLITAWPSYFIWGKKRFWFKSKKNKKTWTFD